MNKIGVGPTYPAFQSNRRLLSALYRTDRRLPPSPFRAAFGVRCIRRSSCPYIAAYAFFYLEGHGDPDLIHALKSGYIIPLLILSLGLPVLRARGAAALK